MISNLINRPCTILHRTETGREDAHGNEEIDETSVVTVCELQQKRRAEPTQGEISVTEWDAFFPAGTEANTGDGLLVDGEEYVFVGDPWDVRHPLTQALHHVQATVVRSAGQGDAS